jgi:hypothetical protein
MASFATSETVFELSGGREMVTAARATELLEAAGPHEDVSAVSVIRLSNKSFGQEAAEIVAERLRLGQLACRIHCFYSYKFSLCFN